MSKIALESLGCKLNQAETESLARQLIDRGHQLTESAKEADVYVLNTCTVTHVADRKARQLLRAAQRANPEATTVAIGCYAERAGNELGRLGAVDLVLGNREKDRLVDILEARGSIGATAKGGRGRDYQTRTRSLVKIQEGCDSFCSFCVVPYTRGKEHSLPPETIVHQVDVRAASGYKEVVLTGTRVGAYRWNGQGRFGLPHLVDLILDRTDIERLRLSSLQPQDLTPALLGLWANERVCPHIHMPLQSGSQVILERMKRPYSAADYERAVSLARAAIPDLAITTDIIVGFPGEGEREFEESYRFCQSIGFAGIHVFPYSMRPGTAAAAMPHRVDERVKRQRSQRMLALARQSRQRFMERHVGRRMTVLWESRMEQSTWSGLTANYLRVFTESEEDLTNQLLEVRLAAERAGGLLGELVTEDRHG